MKFLFVFLLITLKLHASAEKTLHEMSIDEKIGQLFMIAAYVDEAYAIKETENQTIMQDTESYIQKYFVGGIGLVGPSTSQKQVLLLNRYQEMSKYPLLIAQDFEWGLSMRLSDGMRFPKNSTLGAVSDNNLIYEMGKEIGRQAKLVGVQMNLSPDIDVNIEPENPVINVRSFGACPQDVAKKGVAMIKGLQDAGIIASAKHFPGLGDIKQDPHLALPINNQPKKRLEEVELYPFEEAIKAGVLSIQTDHVLMPALEPDTTLASSLSPRIVQGILKEKMGFRGLVLSGALRMKALTENLTQEEIAIKAFLAGSDMLLMPQDLPKAHQAIKKGLSDGIITQKELDERVLKILNTKELVQLNERVPLPIPSHAELHTTDALSIKRKLYKAAVRVVRDKNQLIPLQNGPIAYLQIGDCSSIRFFDELQKQQPCFQTDMDSVDNYAKIIVAVFPLDPRRIAQIRLESPDKLKEELTHFRVHGITTSSANQLKELEKYNSKCVVCYFGNPFGKQFVDGFDSVIMAYEDDPEAQLAVLNLLRH